MPEYYPLSLNSLVNASNQKSNRNPVTNYSESDIELILSGLQKEGFVVSLHESGSRVLKYRHIFNEKVDVGPEGTALLCELMLRGPQTAGELRSHTERMRHFEHLESVESVLQKLAAAGYVVRLPREPGRKESRYAHLLSGPMESVAETTTPEPEGSAMKELCDKVDSLRRELDALRSEFDAFKKQLGS
jgi:hypothetical protein